MEKPFKRGRRTTATSRRPGSETGQPGRGIGLQSCREAKVGVQFNRLLPPNCSSCDEKARIRRPELVQEVPIAELQQEHRSHLRSCNRQKTLKLDPLTTKAVEVVCCCGPAPAGSLGPRRRRDASVDLSATSRDCGATRKSQGREATRRSHHCRATR